jgi:hypothetical protein
VFARVVGFVAIVRRHAVVDVAATNCFPVPSTNINRFFQFYWKRLRLTLFECPEQSPSGDTAPKLWRPKVNQHAGMSQCVLLDLPEAVTRCILVEWLELQQVLRVDAAFCTHALRAAFLSLCYGQCTTFTMRPHRRKEIPDSVFKWAAARRAQLDGMCILEYSPCDLNLLAQFLAVTGASLRRVSCTTTQFQTITDCQHILVDVAKCSSNVLQLDVQGGKWDHQLATVTRAFDKLIDLSLNKVGLTTENLAVVMSQCRCVEKLFLGVTCEIPVEIAVPTLKTLHIAQAGYIPDAVLVAVAHNCANLETLTMFTLFLNGGTTLVTDSGMRAVLQGCPLLRRTDVEYAVGISTELRAEMARRCNFTELHVEEWQGINNDLAQKVLKASPNLIAVTWGFCNWLRDATLAVCAQHCPLLREFVLVDGPLVTSDGVRTLLAGVGASLRELDFGRRCGGLGDELVFAAAEHCPLLRKVWCPPYISGQAVMELVESCPELIHADLRYAFITDADLTALAKHCPKLEHVCLMGCRELKETAVCSFVANCTHLTQLTLPYRFSYGQPKFQVPKLAVYYSG